MSTTVRAVVEDVVAQVAPEEAPLLLALSHVDDVRVARMLRQRRHAEPLGFGLAELPAIVTPIVWLTVDEACRMAVQSSVDSMRTRVTGSVRRLLRRPAKGLTVPELSREQLDLVHRRVREDARKIGIADDVAEALADRVVARLLLARPADGSETEV